MKMAKKKVLRFPLHLSVFICVHLWLILLSSCGSKPTDLRTVIPADALVYLETNDLGKTVAAITQNKSFQQLAKAQPDTSALNGIKLAVAVTGFQTSEQALTDENSVLNFQPRFVAVVETNAWNFQAMSFTENKLGEFINETYGGEVVLETSDKHDGKYFVWTAQDGRKAYALVHGSLIFFGNDESAIEKCLAVSRGEADSIAKNTKIAALPADSLASGYISTDGVAQIANIVGVAVAASQVGEEEFVKSFIATTLPQLLRNSVSEVSWTATKTEQGIEDKYAISTVSDVSGVFSETLSASEQPDLFLLEDLPTDLPTVTLYNLKQAQVAWRSVLLVAQKQSDPVAGKMLGVFSSLVLEPYGVRDVEMFASSVGPTIVTAKLDVDGEKPVVIARIKERINVRRSLLSEFKAPKPEKGEPGVEVWTTADGGLSAAYVGDVIILGDTDLVNKCLATDRLTIKTRQDVMLKRLGDIKTSAAVTAGIDDVSLSKIIAVFGEKKSDDGASSGTYRTQTRFNKSGIERRTVSDFGLIGSIIEQLGKEN